MRLVAFYRVSVNDLVPDPERRELNVVRADEEQHAYSPAKGIDVFLLAPDKERTMMPILATFEPGDGLAAYQRHDGEEFVRVVQGRIEFELEGSDTVVLQRGDSIYFRADRAHSYRNVGRGRAILLAVVTPPTL